MPFLEFPLCNACTFSWEPAVVLEEEEDAAAVAFAPSVQLDFRSWDNLRRFPILRSHIQDI